MNILDFIPRKGGIITAKELAKLMNVGEPTIRVLINKERAKGTPICSCQQGYYYSEDVQDIENTIKFLQSRISTQLKAVYGLIGVVR